MAHHLHLFAGHPEVLRRYCEIVPQTRIYRLTAGSDLAVLPVDEDVLDTLHTVYGTGEWQAALRLTSTDLSFAAESSRRGPLAYLETDYAAGAGIQAAAVWIGGAVALRPLTMTTDQSRGRAQATWPINAALRLLGVVAAPKMDAFETFGLGRYQLAVDIAAGAIPVRNTL